MPSSLTSKNKICLRGVWQNNLKGFDLELSPGKLTVVTGLSGTGKSSLVFETLHAEGQRRYVETFSPYTRQFLERLERPKVDAIEHIRPSIAINQGNSIKTSRSTVGTMTELCDFFKTWFCHCASLYDPATGEKIEDDNPQSIWRKVLKRFLEKTVLVTFLVKRPSSLSWEEILPSLEAQGYMRICLSEQVKKISQLDPKTIKEEKLYVIQDRIKIKASERARFIEATQACLHFGQGMLCLLDADNQKLLSSFCEGLRSPQTDKVFRKTQPALFSFNSPLGACPKCRGFGRVVKIDYRRIIPNQKLTIQEGAIRAFQGNVYSSSQNDLIRACKRNKVPVDIPFDELSESDRAFVLEGEPDYSEGDYAQGNRWYGVKRFFNWLEQNTYKMHVRVFLSKYRSYSTCTSCNGTRLQPEALLWKWHGYTLPMLYHLPVNELLAILKKTKPSSVRQTETDIAFNGILTRLNYLDAVGLGYLHLNRSSRTLSGGEMQRVKLTACLGASLVDTLFVLDEPSIGLHARDIDRLIGILKKLVQQGNTVVVVEHDEAVMQAADCILEIGPQPGANGGNLVFQGTLLEIKRSSLSITGAYLSGKKTIPLPEKKRFVSKQKKDLYPYWLHFEKTCKHNIQNLDISIPLNRFVCLTGISGSGKSTLLDNVIYQGLLQKEGNEVEDPAAIQSIKSDLPFSEMVLVDQSALSRTPRSNAAIYLGIWDKVRQLFARTEGAKQQGLGVSAFSFNSNTGCCQHCQGMGYERVEMQFMADLYIPCPVCEGKRFKPDILTCTLEGQSVGDLLALTVDEAALFFEKHAAIVHRLDLLQAVGLGYLPLGQPLNTLSGGESQRLKLIKYLDFPLTKKKPLPIDNDLSNNALLLLDEPTTGLHRDDIKRLIHVLQQLVDKGHSVVVIEHQMDVIKSADWVFEMGPKAGPQGGKIIFAGPPEQLAHKKSPTAPFLFEALQSPSSKNAASKASKKQTKEAISAIHLNGRHDAAKQNGATLTVIGAREHNLKNLSVEIHHQEITVLTGVSGSGKSSLAFDVIFAEGQRRFMESMSSYARQFIEQLPRPDIDALNGIPPTVAIEQRVTHGTRKSTVATITEVAQYLRLLYARVGIQHSPTTGEALITLGPDALMKHFQSKLEDFQKTGQKQVFLCAPIIRGRKGHHQPIADWAQKNGYDRLRIDGKWVELRHFSKLDRYVEHDIEVAVLTIDKRKGQKKGTKEDRLVKAAFNEALQLGKGICFLADKEGSIINWLSTERVDPATGQAFAQLDPKNFSWNSPKGWCEMCSGYGYIDEALKEKTDADPGIQELQAGTVCPGCQGDRLNPVSSAVKIHLKSGGSLSLPELLRLTPEKVLKGLKILQLDRRGKRIVQELIPEIEERLKFMDTVGLSYLSLDRSTATLSGGEAQRIRLAAQMGSNLSGVLYVLDEPSIGLHPKDNKQLLESIQLLRDKGNTILMVEHDEDTMRCADRIIDLGPAAGQQGGEILANGSLSELVKNKNSLTGQFLCKGIKHPLKGEYRPLPQAWNNRNKKISTDWLVAKEVGLRNLKGDDLMLPIGRLIMVCGISGSGKSTLIRDMLKPAVEHALQHKIERLKGKDFVGKRPSVADWDSKNTLPFKEIVNGHLFQKIIEVDQKPIGKTPRSTPATYLGVFDLIRTHFASLPEAKMRGYGANTFSFNTRGGRCEKCKGAGKIKLEMSFLPNSYIDCEDCQGTRYGAELKSICWRDKSISEILSMTFEEASPFFDFNSKLKLMLDLMVDSGLGYLTLGQSSPTLSGGEAQRLKLASELTQGIPSIKTQRNGYNSSLRNLYLLEEPTIGLHWSDCEKLIKLLHQLVDQGHTVIVVEHHLDLIAEADYVVEMGPQGGQSGGKIVYQGTIENILHCRESQTAPFLNATVKPS